MILALAGQFKQLSHEPEKFNWAMKSHSGEQVNLLGSCFPVKGMSYERIFKHRTAYNILSYLINEHYFKLKRKEFYADAIQILIKQQITLHIQTSTII